LDHLKVSCKLGQIAPATVQFYQSQLRILTGAVGDFPAAELRAPHLVSVKLSHHFVRVLKSLYNWASDADVQLVPNNPFRKLKTPRCGQRTRTLNHAETRALMRECSREFRRLLRVGLRTGARPVELRELRWGQVDLGSRLFLMNSFKAKDKRRDGKAVRAIPLPREVVRLLAALKRRTQPKAEDNVFLNTRGQPWTANATRCAMRTARERAGLAAGGERIVLYTLRHTFATNATRNGIQGRTLADIMGHTSTAMTQRYQHLTAGDLVDVIDQATRRRTA
jgi:integrase